MDIKLDELFNRLKQTKNVVYDVETNGLDWKRDMVVGHVFSFGSNKEDSYYVPVRHEAGGNIERAGEFESELSQVLKNKRIIGHNLKFDVHFARGHGIQLEKYNELECTLVNQSLINELQFKYDLDTCCREMEVVVEKDTTIYEYLHGKFGGKNDRNQMANFWKLAGDDPRAVNYALSDGMATWSLWLKQNKVIDEQNLRAVHGLEMRVLRTLIRMEMRGVRVNEDRLKELKNDLLEKVKEASRDFPLDFNVRSAARLSELFLNQGHDPGTWPRTAPSTRFPNGQPSFTEGWLETFETGKQIILVRQFTNLINSFIDPLLERHLFDWRVHTSFNQIKQDDYGTVSGRLSSSNPNLQQVPKHDKNLAPIFRGVFEADHGMVWSSNDYKQQEFVVFAILSGSERVMNGYRKDPPQDIHSIVAEMMKVDRGTTAKRLNLGKLYGMGKAKLAASLGVDEHIAAGLSKEWDLMMPEAKFFRKACEDVVRGRAVVEDIVDDKTGKRKVDIYGRPIQKVIEPGYIMTLWKRRRRYVDSKDFFAAMSGLIQGTCADICKDKMCEVDEYFESEGDTAHMLLQTHDSLDWQFPEGNEKINSEAQRIMQDFSKPPYEFECPMRIDSGLGKNWKDASL